MTGAGTAPGGQPVALSPSLVANPDLDQWLRVDAADTVTVFTGKAELGQGIVAALARIAAEELDLGVEQIRVQTADTAHPLDEGVTAGSMSVEHSGQAVRQAAAQARAHLLSLAAETLGCDVEALEVRGGIVSAGPGRSTTYWELLGGRRFEQPVSGRVVPKPASEHRLVGRREPQPAQMRGLVTGTTRFVNDLRPEHLAYGRVVRPPNMAATLLDLDESAARAVPGVVAIVRDGSFIGVVAEREDQAIDAAERLRRHATWSPAPAVPVGGDAPAWLRAQADQPFLVVAGTPVEAPAVSVETANPATWTHTATYSRPYVMHASIGPSAAVAQWDGDALHVWSSSQGVHVLRSALAVTLGLGPEQVRVSHVVGAGCYGHNGADDAALDAALLARAAPGRPVRVQWSRADEHQWEPYGPPASIDLRATLDESGRISRWRHDAWGVTHRSRPRADGPPNLLAGAHLEPPIALAAPEPVLWAEAGIHRNATPIYEFPDQRIVKHFVAAMPVRTSSLRSLGAHANVFAIESFMDELALLARASPVEFRLRHLADPRAREVLTAAVRAAYWDGTRSTEFGRGSGVGLARYKNRAGYAAVVARVHVVDETAQVVVERLIIAADCGEIVDPDGLTNQLEGGAIQATSWTLLEQVSFDETAVTSADWDSYPILRFGAVPEITTVLLDRPGEPFLGAGEITLGPTTGAIANAVFDAIGYRLRDLPLTPDRLRFAAQHSESQFPISGR